MTNNQARWANAMPYRGLKWSSLEGGTRVPCIVRWPGVISAGQVTDKLTAAIDLLPTLAHACGIGLKPLSRDNPKIDGVNIWDTLIGTATPHPRKDLLYWNGWGVPQAIRVGSWKLYFDKVKEIGDSDNGPVLIHLVDDSTEQTNLSDQHPEKVNDMKALAEKLLTDIEKNSMPLGGPANPRTTKQTRGVWLQ